MRREIQEAYDQLLPKDPDTIMTITSFTEEEHPKAMAVLANKLSGMLINLKIPTSKKLKILMVISLNSNTIQRLVNPLLFLKNLQFNLGLVKKM